jgi:hypothetical protein
MRLNVISELAWRQLFPNPSDETRIKREEFVESAKALYALEMWKQSRDMKLLEGFFNIPSYLTTEKELDVVNDEIDISKLKVLRSLSDDAWLQNVGGFNCECHYIKSNMNHTQLLCDDDSLSGRTYLVVGDKIKFPQGTHKDKLPIVYANNGSDLGDIEIEDAMAGLVRIRLVELYAGKIGQEDKTNNSNSGT